MKVFAHVLSDGTIQGLVAMPAGELSAVATAAPGTQVCQVVDHNLKGETVRPEELLKVFESHRVAFTPAQGRLVPSKG